MFTVESFNKLKEASFQFNKDELNITESWQFEKMIKSLMDHKWFINQKISSEISEDQALYSWYEIVYEPISLEMKKRNILKYFPKKKFIDIFFEICDHWHYLKEEKHNAISFREVVLSFIIDFGKNVGLNIYINRYLSKFL